MFAYCLNNPISMADEDGNLPRWVVNKINKYSKKISKVKRNSSMYYCIKNTVSYYGTEFLAQTGRPLAAIMFSNALWGRGRGLSNSIKKLMIFELKRSSDLNKIINNDIKKFRNWQGFGATSTVEFRGRSDLHYAIQHANVEIDGYRYHRRWKITVTISDVYDFTEFRNGLGFSDVANNLGWAMQKNGMITPYRWSVSYTYWR